MEPLVSIFQMQDADRSPLLTHIHRLYQEGKFKEVSVTPTWVVGRGLGLHVGSVGQARTGLRGSWGPPWQCPLCTSTVGGYTGVGGFRSGAEGFRDQPPQGPSSELCQMLGS